MDFDRESEAMEHAQIGKAVRKNLECHICRETLVAPVYTCLDAHYICGFCYPKLEGHKAIYCHCLRAIIRFPGLDRTIEVVHKQVDCKYTEGGCSFTDNSRRIMDHVKICKYRY
jgi:hypothetical protein